MNAHVRKTMRIYIIENLIDITDDQIKEICDKISDILQKKCGDMNRPQMITYIEKNIRNVDDANLTDLKNTIAGFMNYEEPINDKKKRIALEITNNLLLAMNKKKIENLIDFIDIRRDDLLSNNCKKVIDDNRDYIFENGFSKEECMVYQKKLRNPHLSVFKGILKQVGYELTSKNKSKRSNGVRDMFVMYYVNVVEQ